MGLTDVTHIAFADESCWNIGRFRSISLISTTFENCRKFHKKIGSIRESYGKREFKWCNINRDHGISLANVFFDNYTQMRIDVLIWDMEDSRHKDLRGRDDTANFARMYYHLLLNVLKQRWPDKVRWLICPDQQKEVDWLKLEQCLQCKSSEMVKKDGDLSIFESTVAFREYYQIEKIHPVNSDKFVLIQLADLFAGLAVYSYASFDKYQHWSHTCNPQSSLIECEYPEPVLSNSDRERLPILDHVRKEAGKRKLYVSLNSSGGLCTKKPESKLNFWLYAPQRPDDKAPIKG